MELFFFHMVIAGLALVVFAAIVFWRTDSHSARPSPAVPMVVVSYRAIARSMLVDHADTFSDRPAAPFHVKFLRAECIKHSYSISTAPHGPLWRALRCNLTAGILHPSRLGLLAGLQREAVDGLVADLSSSCGRGGRDDGVVVVIRDRLHTTVLTLLMRMCFGDGDARNVRTVQRVHKDFFDGMVVAPMLATSRMARLLHWRRWRRFRSVRNRMEKVFLPLIVERCRQRPLSCSDGASGGGAGIQPYVDSLLDLEVPDFDDSSIRRALTDDEKITLVWEFLSAGTETVVSCIEWGLAHLVNQPEVQEKLHREVVDSGEHRVAVDAPYLRAVILESLRLHPLVAVIQRDRDVMVGGGTTDSLAVAVAGVHPVPPKENDSGGSLVHFTIVPGAVGRDGRVWTEPNEFCPERFLADGEGEHIGPMPGPKDIRMLPFGAGTRHCPGMGLGMVHVRLLIAALVTAFLWGLPATGRGGAGAPVDLTEVDGFVKHMKTPLMARIVPRK